MKKTKILVPAMAVLALGMAAAVTGTVAWYSSTNVVYAQGLNIRSTVSTSLQISLAQSGPWGRIVDHSTELSSDAIFPAYCLDKETNPTANPAVAPLSGDPTFVYLQQDLVDGVPNNNVADLYYVDVNGVVRLVADSSKVNPSESAPFTNCYNESTEAWTNVVTDSDWLRLDTTDTDAEATVRPTVHITRSASENIDKAMVFGFLADDGHWEFSKPWRNTEAIAQDGKSVDITLTDITVTDDPAEFKFFMWYDGEDEECKNSNAKINVLNATITYTIVE